jgi:hypothetical protein
MTGKDEDFSSLTIQTGSFGLATIGPGGESY